MAGKSKEPKEAPPQPPSKELKETITPKRPGTSGTELGLRVNRQKAHTSFQRAQRAEQAYRAHRQATLARSEVQAARENFKLVGAGLRAGIASSWNAVRLGPAVWREKSEGRRERRDAKKKEIRELKKKILEEKLKKVETDADEDGVGA